MKRLSSFASEIKNNQLKRSMFISTLCKPISMVIALLYTPLLLSYLGEESYGIWSTILSVINWITFFDVGIGQGLRNTLTKYIAIDDKKKACEAVSTSYVVLSLISGATFIIGSILIFAVNLAAVFNTAVSIRSALLISFACICLNFVLGLSKFQLYATHQAEKVSIMTVLVQVFNYVGILILSMFGNGSLIGVSIVIGLSGISVNLLFSGRVWKKYSFLKPRFSMYNKDELKNVCGIGIKFFFLQIAALVLYSTDNMIITRLFGPSYVTPYHTLYSAFGIVNGIFGAMMSPPIVGGILLVGVFLFKPVSVIWLHRELEFDPGLISCMAIYFFITVWGSIYSTAMNGMGKVNLQLGLAIAAALLNIPLSIFFGDNCGMGSTGVCLATIICMLIAEVPITINVHHFLERKLRHE